MVCVLGVDPCQSPKHSITAAMLGLIMFVSGIGASPVVQIGSPVPAPSLSGNRRLLQITCPDRMIEQSGQCVCAENYYSSVYVSKISVNGTDLLCTGLSQATNLATQCGGTSCSTYTNAPSTAGHDASNTVKYLPYDIFYGNAVVGGDTWYRLDMAVTRAVGGGKIKANRWGTDPNAVASIMPGLYHIWVGDSPSHYSAPGNSLCYVETNLNPFFTPPYESFFTCGAAIAGRYLFVTRATGSNSQFGFHNIWVYPPNDCTAVPNCIDCPNNMKSLPGSLSESDCFVYNALQVNVSIDSVDTGMNQSAFASGLPGDIKDLVYDDQVVVYVETCPAGYFCVSDTTIPAPCPAGTYRDTPGAEALSACLVCPVGHYCPIASTTPTQCAAGTYRGSTGAKQPSDCTPCDSGNFCILGSVTPDNCTAGTYRATPGGQALSDCLVCPVGHFCGIATTTPTPCAAGTYRSSTSGVTQADCQTCPYGYYCPEQSVVPTQCPAGTFGNRTGATLLSQCEACLVGSYCPVASVIPTPCAAGTYRDTIGATEQAECLACPSGHFCPERSVSPTDCPAGSYYNGTHGTQDTNCQPCDPGTYCPVASTLPTSCPAGYFRDTPGGSQLSSCYICPTGQFCPERTVVPTSCLPGTYRATQGATQITDCIPCPAGQYCPFATTTPVDCPFGTYRGSTGGEDRFSCTECPSGNYCPVQSVAPVNCSSGTFRPVPGAGEVAQCLPCPTGEYCHQATTTPSPCPSGTYRDTQGAMVVTDCAVCPIGKYCPLQTTTPLNCSAGTFRSTTGAHQQSDCSPCPSGNYCPETSSSPIDCPVTTYRGIPGATVLTDCLACPPGLYCPLETTTPTPCAAGSYRSTPSAGSQADCPVCPAGSYCPIQTITPIKCRAGTFRSAPGATQLSNCILCQPGTYSLVVGRTTNCPLCDPNFYCRTSTMKDICPLHTTSSAGSYSRVNCLCDPGYQCTYYKQIQAVVTLNATLWEFNNDINGVRTAFIAAMAAAAGVHTSYVTINEVVTSGGRRRALLSVSSEGGAGSTETINVHASVMGAVRLRDLDTHLRRHSPTLHVSHRWEQAPQIHAVAIAGASAPSTRRMARTPSSATPVTGPAKARSAPAADAERKKASERLKSRAIKLVNNEFLMSMLNKP